MVIVLDLDDFSDEVTCERELIKLCDYFDDFKINMFAVPFKTSVSTMERMSEYGCRYYPHGFNHSYLEMDNMSYEDVRLNLKVVNYFRDAGYYGNVFKAPYWRYSKESFEALHDNGYVVAVSREQVLRPRTGIDVYEYDFELDEEWADSGLEILRLHGHCTPYRNSLDLWYNELILKLPKHTKFITIEEYLEGVDGKAYEEGQIDEERPGR